ncbi:MFS transporter [Pseudomonas gingeri NCPPB 3146 = LMG 5327]|uniref:MFS transporter n=2 Tax=Pseudomonas gingeri TaxID=117681 RepID=A0A7Y7Y4E3_9PSED|nr:MFS transporter [Pseudomonas gingeri]NWC17585.1 MFS transporter [Pseudomonas gingeri]PNQ88040.1 MFS transporter [Pseudomonas gingeri NCPPB 3146 = LMG 5327]
MTSASVGTPGYSSLFWLALGTFAIGTEGFMIAGLLLGIASDVSVSIEQAGQLVTFFALAYAISSPILTTLTGHFDKRKVLICSMLAFVFANLLAFEAQGYWTLLGARLLLAFAAGLYAPNANALAAALVPPEKRGSALAVVNGGTTLALVIGVPLGALIGNQLGWRMTFAGVAVLAVIALGGLLLGLHQHVGRGMPTASLAERIAVAKDPAVLRIILVTTLWTTGAFCNYTYLASYLTRTTGISGSSISEVLFVWGISAAIGMFGGGYLTDRLGHRKVGVAALLVLVASFASLSLIAHWLPPGEALVPVLLVLMCWGLAGWAFFPSQLSRLVEAAGPRVAPVALSLNASFLNLGISLGAALGSFTLVTGTSADLGWVAACCEVVAVSLLLYVVRRPLVRPATA